MKLTVIAEGHTKEDRRKLEWGLSFLINDSILFDAFGHAGVFSRNLIKTRTDIKKIKSIIISHCHWDHISGIETVLKKKGHPVVYLPEKNSSISKIAGKYGAEVVTAGKPFKTEEFLLTGPMVSSLKNTVFMEQAAVFNSRFGSVLVAGCSHPGIVKMVKRAQKLSGRRIYAVTGGLHLKDTAEAQVDKIVNDLKAAGVTKVIAGHCTGEYAEAQFKKAFKRGFKKLEEKKKYNIV